MSISFEQIPSDGLIPFFYVEFSDSAGDDSLAVFPWDSLILGQMTSEGSATPLEITQVTADGEGVEKFGDGSIASRQVEAYRSRSGRKPCYVIPLEDDGTAVARVVTITYADPGAAGATASGEEAVYIGGRRAAVGVALADEPADTVLDLVDAINAIPNIQVVASALLADLILTWKNSGALANETEVSTDYLGDKGAPGFTRTIVDTTAGATDPSLTTLGVTGIMGDNWYLGISNPYSDTTNLGYINDELVDRWGPVRQIGGVQYVAKNDTFSNVQSWANAMNSPFTAPINCGSFATPPEEIGAEFLADAANALSIDPARPLQTLEMLHAQAPKTGEELTNEENNLLLKAGCSTLSVDKNTRIVRIQRAISSYKTGAAGATSKTYRNLNATYTWEAIRYDFRTFMVGKYPRHKLAGDGNNFGDGQPVMTPSLGKSEAIGRFKVWETAGWVEDLASFKASLIVERNLSDDDRLDFRLRPDLINQFRIAGVQIQNLL